MKCISKSIALTLAFGALSVASMTSHAEIIKLKLAPGLWEESRTTLINGQNLEEIMRKQMEKNMARMTPEQRAQMPKSMGNMSAGGKVESCLSAAEVAKGIDTESIKEKLQNSAKGCTLNIVSADQSGARFNAVCMGPDGANYKGTGEYKIKNEKEWSFKMVADGRAQGPDGAVIAQAGNFHATQEVQSRWKAGNCGNVKSDE
ncbi:MAG: DUF3617 family protein [Burkholderiales bacterium]|nr:DUF3617 family protein [Burkholderiales bacterium]